MEFVVVRSLYDNVAAVNTQNSLQFHFIFRKKMATGSPLCPSTMENTGSVTALSHSFEVRSCNRQSNLFSQFEHIEQTGILDLGLPTCQSLQPFCQVQASSSISEIRALLTPQTQTETKKIILQSIHLRKQESYILKVKKGDEGRPDESTLLSQDPQTVCFCHIVVQEFSGLI